MTAKHAARSVSTTEASSHHHVSDSFFSSRISPTYCISTHPASEAFFTSGLAEAAAAAAAALCILRFSRVPLQQSAPPFRIVANQQQHQRKTLVEPRARGVAFRRISSLSSAGSQAGVAWSSGGAAELCKLCFFFIFFFFVRQVGVE